MLTHIDLFSGIGGFAYAAREVWGGAYQNLCFCEINKYCQAVLRKNFGKDIVIYDDIRQLTADAETRRHEQPDKAVCTRRDASFSCDLLTGGFPCQPFSQAGKRRGTEDNRYLWPEMLRVIREFNPTWVIAENVRGLLTIEGGVVFEQVCLDLEESGYETQAFIIPACAVNAPHRRDRVWIVANCNGEQDNKQLFKSRRFSRQFGETLEIRKETSRQENWETSNNNNNSRLSTNAPDAKGAERKRGSGRTWAGRTGSSNESWHQSWIEVATRLCGVDDGLPCELDELGKGTCQTCGGKGFGRIPCEDCGKVSLKFTKAGHRVERLKALGNAIVPQVAIEIMKAIQSATLMEELDAC